MMDYRTVRFYTCSKCGYEWTNWDGKNKREGDIPRNCPSCRNIRWNSHYSKDEVDLIQSIEDQHTIWKDKSDWKDIIDFVAYDFLYQIRPMAELFELKKVAVIPHDTPAGMEQRHELMISMIRDRLYSTDKYAKIINKDKAIKNKKEWRVRTSVHQLTPLKFNTWYYHPIRKPWKDCKHEYLMNIFEEALSNAGSYLYNGEHGPNYNIDINGWTKMCFITPK